MPHLEALHALGCLYGQLFFFQLAYDSTVEELLRIVPVIRLIGSAKLPSVSMSLYVLSFKMSCNVFLNFQECWNLCQRS